MNAPACRILIAWAVSVIGAPAAVLVNGSFEGSAGSWNPSGSLQVIDSQGETDGASALAFSWGNQPSTGEIWQSFATGAGLAYRLSFDFGKWKDTHRISPERDRGHAPVRPLPVPQGATGRRWRLRLTGVSDCFSDCSVLSAGCHRQGAGGGAIEAGAVRPHLVLVDTALDH